MPLAAVQTAARTDDQSENRAAAIRPTDDREASNWASVNASRQPTRPFTGGVGLWIAGAVIAAGIKALALFTPIVAADLSDPGPRANPTAIAPSASADTTNPHHPHTNAPTAKINFADCPDPSPNPDAPAAAPESVSERDIFNGLRDAADWFATTA